ARGGQEQAGKAGMIPSSQCGPPWLGVLQKAQLRQLRQGASPWEKCANSPAAGAERLSQSGGNELAYRDNVADTDNSDQSAVVDHGQVADLMFIEEGHRMGNVVPGVAGN